MELAKLSIFMYIEILQLMGKIFGMSCNHQNKFWLHCDWVLFAMALTWFGGCTFFTELCWPGCNGEFPNDKMVALIFSMRLTQLGAPICLILYRCSHQHVNEMLRLSNQLREKKAGFVSVKYNRRNFVMIAIFAGLIASKLIQMGDMKNSARFKENRASYQLKIICGSTSTWPLILLSWQFLAWTQVFNRALKISVDELRGAIMKSLKSSPDAYEEQIIHSVSQVKAVLAFKMKILDVYGLTIVFSQLKAIIWIMLNAFWFYFFYDVDSIVTYFGWILLFNIPICYMPHWAGQEISSEGSKMLYDIFRLQITGHSPTFDKKFSNFLFGLLHESLTFRVCDLFDLSNQQFLSFLSLSIGYLIIQIQMIV